MTSPSSPSLRIGAGAHRGKVREENQDRISRFRCSFGEVFVVADGVGGYQGGAQAAEMVIGGLESHLRELPADAPPAEALREAARRTSADIHRRAQSGDPATADMGSTGVVALLSGRQARIGHAGDCRAYLLRNGELVRLTRDHTRVQQMVERSLLSEEEARNHPDANVVTRAFGKQADLDLEVSDPLELRDGEILLLASDGLCGYVEDAAIAAALRASGDPQEIADRLIGLALAAGGEDNVSVQVIAWQGRPAPATLRRTAPGRAPAWWRRRPLVWAAVAVVLALAFVAGLLLPWRSWYESGRAWWRGKEKPRSEKQETGNPLPEGSVEVRVSIMGEPRGGSLRRLLSHLAPQLVPGAGEAPDGFSRGRIYHRKGHVRAAKALRRELNRTAEGGRTYRLELWPKAQAERWPEVDILVVSWGEPAPPEASPEAGTEEP